VNKSSLKPKQIESCSKFIKKKINKKINGYRKLDYNLIFKRYESWKANTCKETNSIQKLGPKK